jgi:hypothetical protein
MKTNSNYYDNTPLSTSGELLTLLLIVMMGLGGVAVWTYVLW